MRTTQRLARLELVAARRRPAQSDTAAALGDLSQEALYELAFCIVSERGVMPPTLHNQTEREAAARATLQSLHQ